MFSLFFMIVGLVAIAIICVPMYSNIRRLLRLRQAQQTTIAVPTVGSEMAVTGTAAPAAEGMLTAPLTDTPCVFWQLQVQERRKRGKSSKWVTILNQCSTQSFFLNDGTGTVQLQPEGSDPHFQRDYNAARSFFSGLDEATLWRLERAGVETKNWLGFTRALRAYESFVVPGDQICAVGSMNYNGGRPTLGPSQDAPLMLADGTVGDLRGQLVQQVLLSTLFLVLALGFFGLMLTWQSRILF